MITINQSLTKPYQRLKNNLTPFLDEEKNSLYYYLAQKKLHKPDALKRSILNILHAVAKKVNYFDLLKYLISANDMESLNDMILSEKVSSSKKAILNGYDCCLSCAKETVCNRRLTSLTQTEKVNYLLYLRFVKAKRVLKTLKWGYGADSFNILITDPILLKFLANYALVVDIKNELKKDGKIASHKTLYKGAGKYCPFDDFWEAV